MSWDDSKIEKLKTMWTKDRLSANEIAVILGTTRSAVIGKLHRMGMTGDHGGSRQRPVGLRRVPNERQKPKSPTPKPNWASFGMPTRKPEPAMPKLPPEPLPPPTPRVFDPAKLVKTLDLEDHHCRWPVGDPGQPDFRHCGETRIIGLRAPYCLSCAQVAYRPAEKHARKGVNFASGGRILLSGSKESHKQETAAGEAPEKEREDA